MNLCKGGPGGISLAKGVTTLGQGIRSTEMRVSEVAGAVDNIPPAAVTKLTATVVGSRVELAWVASVDDRVVGSVSYRGYGIPICGVEQYEIWGRTEADSLRFVGAVPAGTTTYVDSLWRFRSYRVNSADLDNRVGGPIVTVSSTGMDYRDAEGDPVYVFKPDGDTPYKEDFEDFILFAGAYGYAIGEARYDAACDIDSDGEVTFRDFISFAQAYGHEAVTVNGVPVN
jgi:hypothetical protein